MKHHHPLFLHTHRRNLCALAASAFLSIAPVLADTDSSSSGTIDNITIELSPREPAAGARLAVRARGEAIRKFVEARGRRLFGYSAALNAESGPYIFAFAYARRVTHEEVTFDLMIPSSIPAGRYRVTVMGATVPCVIASSSGIPSPSQKTTMRRESPAAPSGTVTPASSIKPTPPDILPVESGKPSVEPANPPIPPPPSLPEKLDCILDKENVTPGGSITIDLKIASAGTPGSITGLAATDIPKGTLRVTGPQGYSLPEGARVDRMEGARFNIAIPGSAPAGSYSLEFVLAEGNRTWPLSCAIKVDPPLEIPRTSPATAEIAVAAPKQLVYSDLMLAPTETCAPCTITVSLSRPPDGPFLHPFGDLQAAYADELKLILENTKLVVEKTPAPTIGPWTISADEGKVLTAITVPGGTAPDLYTVKIFDKTATFRITPPPEIKPPDPAPPASATSTPVTAAPVTTEPVKTEPVKIVPLAVKSPRLVLTTNHQLSADLAALTIELEGTFAANDPITIEFLDAPESPWNLSVGQSFTYKWAHESFPFTWSLSGNVIQSPSGATVYFSAWNVTYADEESMAEYILPVSIMVRDQAVDFEFLVTPEEEPS